MQQIPVTPEEIVKILRDDYPTTYDACFAKAALRQATGMLGEAMQVIDELQGADSEPDEDPVKGNAAEPDEEGYTDPEPGEDHGEEGRLPDQQG